MAMKRGNKGGLMPNSVIHRASTLREENANRITHYVSYQSILKMKHLQRLAMWSVKDACVPPLGALFGRGLAAKAECEGKPLHPSLIFCERCETILQPGFNCTVRIEKNVNKARHKKSCGSFHNNVVYTCHFCSHRTLKPGTYKGHMKSLLASKPKRLAGRTVASSGDAYFGISEPTVAFKQNLHKNKLGKIPSEPSSARNLPDMLAPAKDATVEESETPVEKLVSVSEKKGETRSSDPSKMFANACFAKKDMTVKKLKSPVKKLTITKKKRKMIASDPIEKPLDADLGEEDSEVQELIIPAGNLLCTPKKKRKTAASDPSKRSADACFAEEDEACQELKTHVKKSKKKRKITVSDPSKNFADAHLSEKDKAVEELKSPVKKSKKKRKTGTSKHSKKLADTHLVEEDEADQELKTLTKRSLSASKKRKKAATHLNKKSRDDSVSEQGAVIQESKTPVKKLSSVSKKKKKKTISDHSKTGEGSIAGDAVVQESNTPFNKLLSVSSKKKRKTAASNSSKKSADARLAEATASGHNTGGSSKRKRKRWITLKEIAEINEQQKRANLTDFAIPFRM